MLMGIGSGEVLSGKLSPLLCAFLFHSSFFLNFASGRLMCVTDFERHGVAWRSGWAWSLDDIVGVYTLV